MLVRNLRLAHAARSRSVHLTFHCFTVKIRVIPCSQTNLYKPQMHVREQFLGACLVGFVGECSKYAYRNNLVSSGKDCQHNHSYNLHELLSATFVLLAVTRLPL